MLTRRGGHPRPLRPARSTSTAARHGDEREPEPEADDRERRRRAPANERCGFEQRVDAEHRRRRRAGSRSPSAARGPRAASSSRDPAGDDHRHRHRDELERDPPAREVGDDLQVERGEEEHREEAEARREARPTVALAERRDPEELEPQDRVARLRRSISDERRPPRRPRSTKSAPTHQRAVAGVLALDHGERDGGDRDRAGERGPARRADRPSGSELSGSVQRRRREGDEPEGEVEPEDPPPARRRATSTPPSTGPGGERDPRDRRPDAERPRPLALDPG